MSVSNVVLVVLVCRWAYLEFVSALQHRALVAVERDLDRKGGRA